MKLNFIKAMGLKSKLILTMMLLFILSSLVLFLISQNAQKKLISEFEDNIDDLTKAIQVSVQKLTSEEQIDAKKMEELIKNLKKKGINEISILSEDREIIASSNPKKVGLAVKKNLKESDFLIKAELGQRGENESIKEFNIPIIIGNENYGYINIVMHIDSLSKIQKKNFYIRLSSTLIIFLIGTAFIIFLANRYTKPIHEIVDATKKIAKDELITLPLDKTTSPELRELIINFNDMVKKLSERKMLEGKIKEMEHLFQVGQISSAIAHEIKNPLNFMSLAVGQIIDEANKTSIAKDFLPLLTALDEEIKKLNSLITNFLDYGRPLKLKMEHFKFFNIFNDLILVMQNSLNEQKVTVHLSGDDTIEIIGDKEKLSACFLNLFLNSIEAMKNGGVITVFVKRLKEKVIVTFCDTGSGIPESIKDKIFEPYFTSKNTGMGLGLAFTKKIILEHGGSIWLNSTSEDGTEFIIELPTNL